MIRNAPSRVLTANKFLRSSFLMMLLLQMGMFSSDKASAATDVASAPPMTLEQVVDKLIARNEERAKDLRGFDGNRTYDVRYHGFPKDLDARMVVSMRYEAPNTKEFTVISQSGPKLLVDQVLKRLLKTETDAQRKNTKGAVNLDRNNYVFSDLQYVQAANGCSYVLSVEPKKPNKYLYRGKIRVNDQDFAVCSIQAEPAENPSFWITSTTIHQTYEKIGNFWLPLENKSVSTMRFGGSATLTIQYQDYKIQTQRVAHADGISASGSDGK